MTKYVKPWIPREAFEIMKKKKLEMERDFENITGKKQRIPMMRLWVLQTSLPLPLSSNEVINIANGKRRRK